MNNNFKIFFVVLLVILHERAEFFFYMVNENDKICLLFSDRCFRADSFIAFASTRIQYIIQSLILLMLIPSLKKPFMAYLIANCLYFIEYFFTYNEPIGRIDLVSDLYIPISIATIRCLSLIYLFAEAVRAIYLKRNL